MMLYRIVKNISGKKIKKGKLVRRSTCDLSIASGAQAVAYIKRITGGVTAALFED